MSISISAFSITAQNPDTPFFNGQGPSFYVANYTRPRLNVTVSSSSDIVSYEYFGSIFNTTSLNPYLSDKSDYIGPVMQYSGNNLSVSVRVKNVDNETATTSISGISVLDYVLPAIGDINYAIGDWIQSPSGYTWTDDSQGNCLKVSTSVSICLDGSEDIYALNPPNTCTVQFLVNEWVLVTSNDYQSGHPEIVAVLSDVVHGQDFDLTIRVRDSISGWIRKTLTIPGDVQIVIDDELSSTSTNPVQNKVITAALGSTGQAADTVLDINSTNPVQNKVITAALNSTNSDVDNLRNSLNGLGSLAHADTVSATYAPSGVVGYYNTATESIEAPIFSGIADTISLSGSIDNGNVAISTSSGTPNYTPSGNVSASFSGSSGSVSVRGTPSGAISTSNTGTINYTPTGNITADFNGISGSVSVSGTPSGTIKVFAGTSEKTYTPSGTVSTPIFSGNSSTITVSGIATGNVSQPSFSGTSSTITVSGTAAGSVSKPTFTGDTLTINVSGTPVGDISQPIFTGTAANVVVSGTATGNISTPTFTGDNKSISVSGTPSGTVSVTTNTSSVNGVNDVGTLPTLQATYNVHTEDLSFSWDAGALTTITSKTFVTSINKSTFSGNSLTSSGYFTPTGNVSTPSFTGSSFNSTGSYTPTGNVSKPSFTGIAFNSTGSITPTGNVSQPNFTGTPFNSTGAYTPEGSVSQPTFTGSVFSSTGSYTPSGTVSQPNFTGSSVNLTANFSGNSLTSTGTFTPSGTIVNKTFTGTGVNVKFTGNELISTGTFTPSGSVTNVTFTGTGVNLVGTVMGGNISANVSYTPRGTISNLTFSGNTATITSSAD